MRNSKTLAKAALFFICCLIFASQAFAEQDSRNIDWTDIPEAPTRFGKAVCGVVGDYFYVFGGQPHTNLALVYSFDYNMWMLSLPSDNRFSDAGYCVADGAIYRISGKGSRNTAEKFTPDSLGIGGWSYITPPSSQFRKTGNSCCWDGGDYIYINNCDNSNSPNGYFAKYSITDDNWIILAPPIEPRRYAGIAAVNDSVYLIGGLGANDSDPHSCQVYDPENNTWSMIAPHPDPLNYANSTTFSDGVYIWTVGHGGGYGNFSASEHVHFYNPAENTWNEETDLPVVRGLSAVGYQPSASRVIQVGGTIGNGMRFVSDGRIGQIASAEPGILTGHVIDNFNYDPVVDVEVSVFNSNDILVGADTTDENGFYILSQNPGTYYAIYTKFSYLDSTISNLVVNSNDTTFVNVILTFQHQCDYIVGDFNGSGSVNGLDVIYAVAYYKGGWPPDCLCECTPGHIWQVCGDVNASCSFNGLDVTFLVGYFKGGSPPMPCPDCPPINPATGTG